MASALKSTFRRLSIPTTSCSAANRRWQSSFSHLEREMKTRKIRPIFDDLMPQYSYRLDTSLADFVPDTIAPRIVPATSSPLPLPIPHHLLYFEPTKPPSMLLADGTNPDQSPGEPFVRRMWAGGTVHYNTANPLLMNGARGVCAEFIRNVAIKGQPGDEKVFVGIERRIAYLDPADHEALALLQQSGRHKTSDTEINTIEHRIRQRVWRDKDSDFGPCSVVETRNIVFMRERTPEQLKAAAAAAQDKAAVPAKMLKPQHEADFFTHTIVPDEKLLFRFSALTFNAHAIHLDPGYCRNVEGHRDLLFHGPLSFVFLMEMLQHTIAREGGGESVTRVEYRNLAPLYCHEPIKLCGRRDGEGRYEIWAETPEGGIAVKGSVRTEKVQVQ